PLLRSLRKLRAELRVVLQPVEAIGRAAPFEVPAPIEQGDVLLGCRDGDSARERVAHASEESILLLLAHGDEITRDGHREAGTLGAVNLDVRARFLAAVEHEVRV